VKGRIFRVDGSDVWFLAEGWEQLNRVPASSTPSHVKERPFDKIRACFPLSVLLSAGPARNCQLPPVYLSSQLLVACS
jgi:hypothetical protein